MLIISKQHSRPQCAAQAAGKGKKDAGPGPQEPDILTVVPLKKGFELPAKKPAQRTAYRKPSNKDQLAGIKAARRLEEQERLKRLASPGPNAAPKKPPVMLIDAYNCLFQDPYLKEWMEKEPEVARGELDKRVAAYADVANIKCQLVYDAMGANIRSEGTFTQVSNRVVAVFVSQSEADTYIIKKAWSFKQKGASEVIVVSSDRQVITGVRDEDYSITTHAADEFMNVIKACSKGNTSSIRRYASMPGSANMSWYTKSSAALATQGSPQAVVKTTTTAKDAAAAALELEDALEGILHKHGALMSLKDLRDGDDTSDDYVLDGPVEEAAMEEDGEGPLDLGNLDDLLGKRIV